MRFKDLQREVHGIAAKMLSKELQDLELKRHINRKVVNTKPISVDNEISEYGKTIKPIIDELAKWGIAYRQKLHRKSSR